jgi:glutaredoxin
MLRRGFLLTAIATIAFVGTGAERAAATNAGTAARSIEVVMYATKTCGYCAKARAYFQRHGVAFQERDVETSAQAQKEWKSLGGAGTPLILVDGERIYGFNQKALDAALAKHGK